MMAILWRDIEADIESSKRHLEEAIAMCDEWKSGIPLDYRSAMAFQHAMLAGYTSLESALTRILAMLDERPPVGPDSHAALLRRVAQAIPGERPAIFSTELRRHADELRRFRHIALHTYDDFDPERAAKPVDAARAVLTGIDAAIATFRATVDPD